VQLALTNLSEYVTGSPQDLHIFGWRKV